MDHTGVGDYARSASKELKPGGLTGRAREVIAADAKAGEGRAALAERGRKCENGGELREFMLLENERGSVGGIPSGEGGAP